MPPDRAGQDTSRHLVPRPVRALAGTLPLLALTGCGAAADGSVSPGVWGPGLAVGVLALGGTALGIRRAAARRLRAALDKADADRDALIANGRAQIYGMATERHALLGERAELVRRLTEAAEGQAELARLRDEAAAEQHRLMLELDEIARERDDLQGSVDATFVNLAMRTLTLVERQLVLIEGLEGREADSAQLESLFRLDHLATRMRRNSENMLLLAGLENSHRSRQAVSLLDVVRAAVSEIERYERVRIGFLAAVRLSGAAADDTSHLLAELLENATAFTPPQDQVEVGGWLLDNGEVMLSVVDRGIGIPAERLRQLNEQLSEPVEPVPDRRDALLAGALTGRSMGLFVVARLARRHGMRVQLRENAQGGGVTAMVVLPREALLQDAVSTSDLDDQRHAERSAAAEAEQGRAAEQAAAPAPPPAAPRAATSALPAARTGDDGPLPELPRRKPARTSGPAPQEPAGEHRRAEEAEGHADTRTSTAAAPAAPAAPAVPAAPTVPSTPAAPAPGLPVTSRGLPRRVPSGNGLPGTGEAPVSGLRRVAVAADPAADLPARAPGPQGAAEAPRKRGISPEELRRRLGGFQGGLQQAARGERARGTAGGSAAAGARDGSGAQDGIGARDAGNAGDAADVRGIRGVRHEGPGAIDEGQDR
ncbi:sensor histidine kinase [Kitasatospora sp. NE20-6]|uniref:sensor histidine kinase n=1 Tax=Kitasatospora sp. NE20-6 TaxID=2859066 RepID=UPI0038B391F5